MPTSGDIFEGIAAVGTLGAALFAAASAYFSSQAVKESRAARKADLAPRLFFEKDFLDFEFQWPHADAINGSPAFLARKHWKDKAPSTPTFSLSNYGAGPAREVRVIFEFDDPNDDLYISEIFSSRGFRISVDSPSNTYPSMEILRYPSIQGVSTGLPLYLRSTVDVPHCAPGQTRNVEMPQGLMNRLFLRGLIQWEKRRLQKLYLTVKIVCYTVEGERQQGMFKFEASPFFKGSFNPMIVCSHLIELPIHPIGTEPRSIKE